MGVVLEQIHIDANENVFIGESIGNVQVVLQPGTVRVSQNIKHYVTQVTTKGTVEGRGGRKKAENDNNRAGEESD